MGKDFWKGTFEFITQGFPNSGTQHKRWSSIELDKPMLDMAVQPNIPAGNRQFNQFNCLSGVNIQQKRGKNMGKPVRKMI